MKKEIKKTKKVKKAVEAVEVMDLPKGIIQIDCPGFELHFINPDDEPKLNDLMSSGKVIGQVVYDSPKTGDQMNKVIVVVRNDNL